MQFAAKCGEVPPRSASGYQAITKFSSFFYDESHLLRCGFKFLLPLGGCQDQQTRAINREISALGLKSDFDQVPGAIHFDCLRYVTVRGGLLLLP